MRLSVEETLVKTKYDEKTCPHERDVTLLNQGWREVPVEDGHDLVDTKAGRKNRDLGRPSSEDRHSSQIIKFIKKSVAQNENAEQVLPVEQMGKWGGGGPEALGKTVITRLQLPLIIWLLKQQQRQQPKPAGVSDGVILTPRSPSHRGHPNYSSAERYQRAGLQNDHGRD